MSLEVKAGELIISVLTNMRCKGCHRSGIARFQLCKGLEIFFCRGICVLLGPKRFESTQCLRLTPQNQVAHRSAPELFHPRRKRVALTHTRVPELLVGGGFQSAPQRLRYHRRLCSRRSCDHRQKTADDRRPCMSTDTSDPSVTPFCCQHSRNDCANASKAHAQLTARAAWSACSPGGPEQHMQGITNDLCNAVPSCENTRSVMPV